MDNGGIKPYHESPGLTEAQKATGRRTSLYILQFRYKGSATNSKKLQGKLESLGWNKINDLTSCFVKRIREAEDIDQEQIIEVLHQHIQPTDGDVSFGISKYVPPNERDKLVGIASMFDESKIVKLTYEE